MKMSALPWWADNNTNPWSVDRNLLTAAQWLTHQQWGWTNQATIDLELNLAFFYAYVLAQGGTALTPAGVPVSATRLIAFLQENAVDPFGPAQGGTAWLVFDDLGREIAQAAAEGCIIARDGGPMPV